MEVWHGTPAQSIARHEFNFFTKSLFKKQIIMRSLTMIIIIVGTNKNTKHKYNYNKLVIKSSFNKIV